jgi:hypothetical protein
MHGRGGGGVQDGLLGEDEVDGGYPLSVIRYPLSDYNVREPDLAPVDSVVRTSERITDNG